MGAFATIFGASPGIVFTEVISLIVTTTLFYRLRKKWRRKKKTPIHYSCRNTVRNLQGFRQQTQAVSLGHLSSRDPYILPRPVLAHGMSHPQSLPQVSARALYCNFLEVAGYLPFVVCVFISFEMLALAFDHNHRSDRPFIVPLLNHEIRIDLVPSVSLNREALCSNKISVPPQDLGMLVQVQSD